MSNLLVNYPQSQDTDTGQETVTSTHYTDLLRQYAVAHTQSRAANASLPYVGENIEPHDGYWVARQIMYGDQPISHGGYAAGPQPPTSDRDRSVDYLHSTFADLVIEGYVGVRSSLDDAESITLHPLAGGDANLTHFALDNMHYHSHNVSVAFDRDGDRGYPGCKKGLCVWVDGRLAATSLSLAPLKVPLSH